MVSLANPDCLKELKVQFEQSLTSLDAVPKFISVDGESIRGYRSKMRHPIHIVTVYDEGHHLSLGQATLDEKSKEIVAIPQLLRTISIRKSIVTIDAMARRQLSLKGKADYCLAVKRNQETLYAGITLYFSDAKLLKKLEVRLKSGNTGFALICKSVPLSMM